MVHSKNNLFQSDKNIQLRLLMFLGILSGVWWPFC